MVKRIGLHSVPRSGSTWLGSILDSSPNVIYRYQPLFSYAFKGYLNPNSSKEDIIRFFFELERTKDPFVCQLDEKKKKLVPEFEKSDIHTIAYKEVRYHHVLTRLMQIDPQIKIIGLIRNPLSVLSSWIKAPKEFRPDLGWKVNEEWRYAPSKNLKKPEEFNGYEKWKETAVLFHHLAEHYPDRFLLVHYQDLIENPVQWAKVCLNFCDVAYTEQTSSFIEDSTQTNNSDVYSVFKKKSNDDKWKENLPEYIVNEIVTDLKGSKLSKYLPKNF